MSHRLRIVALLALALVLLSQISTAFSNSRKIELDFVKIKTFSLSDYAGETNAGQFPSVTLNKANVRASLSNVSGLILGRRDNSRLLFSHSQIIKDAPPIEIFERPAPFLSESVYKAKYACRISGPCTLTMYLAATDNTPSGYLENQNLQGFHLAGTDEYFIMEPDARRTYE